MQHKHVDSFYNDFRQLRFPYFKQYLKQHSQVQHGDLKLFNEQQLTHFFSFTQLLIEQPHKLLKQHRLKLRQDFKHEFFNSRFNVKHEHYFNFYLPFFFRKQALEQKQ